MRQFVRLEVAKDKVAQNVVVEHEIDMVGFSVERQPLLPCHRLWLGDICSLFGTAMTQDKMTWERAYEKSYISIMLF